jgi:uncharacterized repeat protein (TIGR01451 family)
VAQNRRFRSIYSYLVWGALALCCVVWSDSALAIQRAFAARFTLNAAGDITIAANANTTCSQVAGNAGAGANCTDAQTVGSLNRANNGHKIVHVDIDADATTFNSSSARLNVPAGATIAFAGLYWGGVSLAATRNTIRLATPSSAGAYTTLTAAIVDDSSATTTPDNTYQGFADVTNIVSLAGAGTYTVANIFTTVGPPASNASTGTYSGWSLVVVYRLASEPTRNMVVYDGYQRVLGAAFVDVSLSGFTTPPFGTVTSKLGIVGYDGDKGSAEGTAGLLFGTSTGTLSPVFNAANPQTDVFNSTISTFGVNTNTRQPNHINTLGFDADIFSPNTQLPNGATTAVVRVTSSGETIDLGVVTLATNIFVPNIKDTFIKSVTDVNGGVLVPGDVLEYSISFSNTGNDPATRTTIIDAIPPNTTYVPNSIVYASTIPGLPTGARTDAVGDDIAEFDAGGNRIVARVGRTATAVLGGQLNPNDNQTVRYRVTVNAATPGETVIDNFATVTFRSLTVGTDASDVSDADLAAAGDQPARIVVASPDLTVLKTHSPTTFVQQSLLPATPTFSIVVANTGTAPSFGTVTVTDLLPAGFSALSLSGTGWTCSVGTVSCSRTDALAAGASYPPITLAVSAANSGTFTNSVTVACNCEGPTRTANNTGTDTVVVTPSAQLTITKTNGVTSLAAGQTTSYTIVVSNAGPSAANDSVLTDSAVPGLSCTSVTCSSATATCPAAPITVASLQAGLLVPGFPANSSLTFTVTCGVTASGL